jgi:hypothetical protein
MEQIDRHERHAGTRRLMKKLASRRRRQEEKSDPKGAPRANRYRGYSM